MITLAKIEYWADQHHPLWLDILRITLGLILIIKGINLISEKEAIVQLVKSGDNEFLSFIIAHYVIVAHIVGGVAIGMGAATRVIALLEIPVLIGAMLILNISEKYQSIHSGYEFTIIVFLLLILFFIYGSGPLSLDHYLGEKKEDNDWIKIG